MTKIEIWWLKQRYKIECYQEYLKKLIAIEPFRKLREQYEKDWKKKQENTRKWLINYFKGE